MFELDKLFSAHTKLFILCLKQNIYFSLGLEVNIYGNIYIFLKKYFFLFLYMIQLDLISDKV